MHMRAYLKAHIDFPAWQTSAFHACVSKLAAPTGFGRRLWLCVQPSWAWGESVNHTQSRVITANPEAATDPHSDVAELLLINLSLFFFLFSTRGLPTSKMQEKQVYKSIKQNNKFCDFGRKKVKTVKLTEKIILSLRVFNAQNSEIFLT